MKIKKIKLVAHKRGPKHYSLFKEEFLKRKITIDSIEIPDENCFDTTNCSSSKFKNIRNLLNQRDDEVTVFIPSTTELFPKEADFIICFSGYRSWFDDHRLKIIPYVWEQAQILDSWKSSIIWQEKPKLSVGFLGNSYEHRKCVTVATRLPDLFKQLFLKGKHLDYIYGGTVRLAQTLGLVPCFMRVESLRQLTECNLPSDIIKYGKSASVTPQEIKNYQNHILRNTYILCPRGIENYSFRFYETLAYGRIPILIDTDTVLPPGINWDQLCVRVPYNQLNNLESIIRQDYETKTKQDFLDRQQAAIQAMEKLNKLDWIQDIVEEIVQAVC